MMTFSCVSKSYARDDSLIRNLLAKEWKSSFRIRKVRSRQMSNINSNPFPIYPRPQAILPMLRI
jgi:hypothetical protein